MVNLDEPNTSFPMSFTTYALMVPTSPTDATSQFG